ncbi:MAG: acetolactate synthase small subunit [Alphaproteobacteria bacterium]|nr:acetolactate synthase small subunit [Alphaproteobacteria bacterium]HCQ70575.1 acetolactate synthase small subunit [Rhodospirillaceae bacterium]|tara:strand:- start:51960 stop:52535 length:576 start_codon:yes stop_codon:yes gene_type:complete
MTNPNSGYSKSVYAPSGEVDKIKTHTLSILVENKPGALAKIIGFFTGRGYNIDSLSVAETDKNYSLSRLVIVTSGADIVLELIKSQLQSLIQVRSVRDLTTSGPFVARELALVKLSLLSLSDGDKRDLQDVTSEYDATIVTKTKENVIYQCIGSSAHVTDFVSAIRAFDPLGISRSGIAALPSGSAPDDHN